MYEQKALLFAEKYGVIEYEVKGNTMQYVERFPTEGNYDVSINLDTMEESRTKESRYALIDTCNDDETIHELSFDRAKEWLLDFWREDEDMDEEEYDEYAEEVNQVKTASHLNTYLGGIGYALELILSNDN